MLQMKIVNAAARGSGDPGTVRPQRLIISTGPLPSLHAAQTANGTGSQKALPSRTHQELSGEYGDSPTQQLSACPRLSEELYSRWKTRVHP